MVIRLKPCNISSTPSASSLPGLSGTRNKRGASCFFFFESPWTYTVRPRHQWSGATACAKDVSAMRRPQAQNRKKSPCHFFSSWLLLGSFAGFASHGFTKRSTRNGLWRQVYHQIVAFLVASRRNHKKRCAVFLRAFCGLASRAHEGPTSNRFVAPS